MELDYIHFWETDSNGHGLLAGIGFTMSIFVTLLVSSNTEQIATAKIAIIFASLFSAIFGLLSLHFLLKK